MSFHRSLRRLPKTVSILTVTALVAAVPGILVPAVADHAPTATERALHARPTPGGLDGAARAYDIDDWFVLSTPRHEDGQYRAFAWRIPTGAVQPLPEGPPLPTIRLELVTLADRYAPGQDWSLFAFHEDEGEARLVFAILGATLDREDLSTTPTTSTTEVPNAGGVVLPYTSESLEDGDLLHFVLVGHGDPSSDMAFAFRVAPTDPSYPPAPDFDAFVGTEPDPPYVPEVRGTGTVVYAAYYNEFIKPKGPQYRVANDAVAHEHATTKLPGPLTPVRPVATAVESDAGSGPGWTLVYVQHVSGAEAAHWTLDVAAQGETARSNGPSVNDPIGATGAVAQRAVGKPLALFMVDGDGASRVRLTLQGAEADRGTATVLQHHRFSAPLAAVIGVASATWTGIAEGDSGGLPWVGELPA